MPFIPVPDAAEVVVNYHIGAVPFVNVFGYNTGGTLTQAITDNIGSTLDNAYGRLLGAQKTTVIYDSVVATDLNTATGPQFTATTFAVTAGTDTVELLPFQTAALISWSTDIRGRSFRGRTYLGGFCEDHSSGRDISGTLMTALGLFRDDILSDPQFAVISRYELNPTPPPGSIPRTSGLVNNITNGVVHPLWRTQRRRATH